MKIDVTAIACRGVRDAYLVENADQMPEDIAPFRVCGRFTYADGRAEVFCEPSMGLEAAAVMIQAIPAFVQLLRSKLEAHVEVEALERLLQL